MGLNILLVNVRKESREERDYFDGRVVSRILKGIDGYGIYPLSLPLIAALTPDRHTVTILDENIEESDHADDYDIVGFTAMTWQAPRVYRLAERYHRRGVYTVMGGIHATMLPDEVAQHVDTVIAGEAENTWREFLADFEVKRTRKLYRNTETIDPDQYPSPRYDLIPREKYLHDVVQISRGCPYRCDFCSVHKYLGGKVRMKSPRKVFEDIRAAMANYRARVHSKIDKPIIVFNDDNIGINPVKLEAIVTHLENQDMVPEYTLCETSLDTAKNEKVIGLLKRLNCIKVFIGFESLSTAVLASHSKTINHQDDYARVIGNLRKNSMDIIASFIIGNDHETRQDIQAVTDFIVRHNITSLLLNILTPYPGTDLFERLESQNRITTKDWSLYDIKNVVFQPAPLTARELRQAWLEVYAAVMEPCNYRRRLKNRLRQITNPSRNLSETLCLAGQSFSPAVRSAQYTGALAGQLAMMPFFLRHRLNAVEAFDVLMGIDCHDFIRREMLR
jgi:radical SAM superfamily enzyme YgiQ (UPF0313 family)